MSDDKPNFATELEKANKANTADKKPDAEPLTKTDVTFTPEQLDILQGDRSA